MRLWADDAALARAYGRRSTHASEEHSVIPSRLRRALLCAVVAAAALPAAASGATTIQLKVSVPDRDARLEQLQLRASCSTACTIKPVKVGAIATRPGGIGKGEQLPEGFEGPIKTKAKRLKVGRID